ncbi:MAG: monovalent cation/H+ antiporter subunit D family protein [Methanotrichaceae archaeon]|nr:monovalent cation/H+ antiporter subunit D family protein [Methanotrichaceae archaeon]
MESITPLLVILCPAIAAVLISISRNKPNIREVWTIAASIVMFALVLSMAPAVVNGAKISYTIFPTMFENINFGFRVDAFGLIFAITTSSLWILVSFYSIGYMRALNEHGQTRFFFFFCLAILGALGVALSSNLLTLFIFYEIITISTYPLIIHEQTPEALKAGHKYFAYLLTSGVFLLFAIMFTYYLTGTTDFIPGGIPALASATQIIAIIIFFCFLLGFLKSAWMPFHSWLPTAMIAPTPVSALLHAVAVVKAGVFGIVRIVCYIYGVDLMQELNLWLVLAIIAGFTMLVASFFAIAQDDLKKRLAYSIISQLSYIILGAAMVTQSGISAAMLYIPFHGYMKITLFLCAGAIMVASGKRRISEMAGLGKTMPVTMLAFSVGAIGMVGLPPVCGFISKLFLCFGAWELFSPYNWIFLAVILISSLLDVIYFFPIIHAAFFKEPIGEGGMSGSYKVKEAPRFMLIPLVITAAISIIFFIHPNTFYIYDLMKIAVGQLFGGV